MTRYQQKWKISKGMIWVGYFHSTNTNSLPGVQSNPDRNLDLNTNINMSMLPLLSSLIWMLQILPAPKSWEADKKQRKEVEVAGRQFSLLDKNRRKAISRVTVCIKITDFKHARQLPCKTDVLHSLNCTLELQIICRTPEELYFSLYISYSVSKTPLLGDLWFIKGSLLFPKGHKDARSNHSILKVYAM